MDFPSQTPLFYSTNRSRYERQTLIRNIEKETGRRLVVYISNFNHPQNDINNDDVLPFTDIFYDIPKDSKVDLLLHSPGGNPNAAEQLVNIMLSKTNDIRVIVPQSAKSAGTMISLVANEIVMSDSSELGPIDPQITVPTPLGHQYRPAKALLSGLNKIIEEAAKNNNVLSPVYFPVLQGIDPSLIHFCEMTVSHTKKIAQKWLERSMCSGDPTKAVAIADQLLDIEKYASHGAVINWEEATIMGLKINYLPPNDHFWEAIWRLFCLYDVDLKADQLVKIFEGSKASVCK